MESVRPKLSFYAFSMAVKAYRKDTAAEISNYAIHTNYEIYIKGNESPLIRRVEQYLGRSLESLEENKQFYNQMFVTKGRKIRTSMHTPGILDKILPLRLSKNLKYKTDIYLAADEYDMDYAIIDCNVHGESLWRISTGKHGDLSGKCCFCEALSRITQAEERYKQAVRVFNEFMKREGEEQCV